MVDPVGTAPGNGGPGPEPADAGPGSQPGPERPPWSSPHGHGPGRRGAWGLGPWNTTAWGLGPWGRAPWHGRPWRHGRWGWAPWGRRPCRRGPLRRSRDDRLVGGVAGGLAARIGVDPTVARVGFLLAALLGGFGAAVYLLAWLLLPADGAERSIGSAALGDRRGLALAAALVSLLLLAVVAISAAGVHWARGAVVPLAVGVAGLTLIWRNAPSDERATLERLLEPFAGMAGAAGSTRRAVRYLVAAAGLVAGLSVLLSGHRRLTALRPLAGIVLVVGGLVVLLAPWWLRIVRDLVAERQARARAEERADLAARVHDSVLQTLALIQRRADDPQQVIQLARAQERELRSWLFDGRPPGPPSAEASTLAGGVRLIQQEVEAQHQIAVEAVTVGDCQLDDRLTALLAAAREATVNAAKWSGAPVVSLFAEVEPGAVSVFIRDRGRGFDPTTVAPDRKGLAESVRGRMARHGGTVTVRSATGQGTEVSLSMSTTGGGRPAPIPPPVRS